MITRLVIDTSEITARVAELAAMAKQLAAAQEQSVTVRSFNTTHQTGYTATAGVLKNGRPGYVFCIPELDQAKVTRRAESLFSEITGDLTGQLAAATKQFDADIDGIVKRAIKFRPVDEA